MILLVFVYFHNRETRTSHANRKTGKRGREELTEERAPLKEALADPSASVAEPVPVAVAVPLEPLPLPKMVVEPMVEVMVDPSVVMVVKIASVVIADSDAPAAGTRV